MVIFLGDGLLLLCPHELKMNGLGTPEVSRFEWTHEDPMGFHHSSSWENSCFMDVGFPLFFPCNEKDGT